VTKLTPEDEFPILTDILVAGQIPLPEPERISGANTRSTEDWETLERDMREAVLRGLHTRIDAVLDQRVREAINSIQEPILAELGNALKNGLNDTVRDIVHRAVAQEISRLRSTRS
jgi:hypothetical protein